MQNQQNQLALKISLLYCLITGTWVWLSNGVVNLSPEAVTAAHGQIVKGLGFTLVTAVALYFVAGRLLRKCEQTAAERVTAEHRQVEQGMLDSLDRLHTILNNFFSFVGLLTLDGRLIEVNRVPLEVAGLKREDVLGKPFTETYWWSYAPAVQERLRLAIRRAGAGEIVRYEEIIRVVNDQRMIIDFTLSPLRDRAGGIVQIVASAVNITERRRMESALQESEERFRALVTFSPDAIYLHVDGLVTFVNPAMCRLLGAAEPAQLLGKSVFDIVHPDYHALVRGRLKLVFDGVPAAMIEEKFVRVDGSAVAVEVSAVLLEIHGRKEVQVIARDISDRKRAENHIQHLNRVYSLLSGTNETIVREKDAQKLFETACRFAVEKGGFCLAWIGLRDASSEKLRLAASAGATGETLALLRGILEHETDDCGCAFTLHALRRGEHGVCNDIEHDPQSACWRTIALERNYRAMAALPLKAGGQVAGTFNLYASEAEFFDAGELALLDELARDISFAMELHQSESERRHIEEELRWKSAFLEAEVHSALDGILVVDRQGKIILRNQRFTEMWNLPPQIAESYDHPRQFQYALDQIKHPAKAEYLERIAQLYAHPAEVSRDELELVDGRILDRYSAPVQDQTGTYYGRIWTFHDITRERQAEADLRLSEAQLRATFEGAAIGMALVNLEGRPIKCNPALTRMLGYSEAELSRMSFSEFTHPEDAAADLQLYRSLLAGERDQYEIQKRYVRKDGQIVWARLIVSLVKQADGTPPLAIGMVEDITARYQLEEQFRQAQKMEAIGQLAGGVAHDFNNILSIIQLQAGLLGMEEKLDTAQREVAGEIVLAAERAANLTRQLLTFSRRQAIQPANLDLNEVVRHMTKMLQRILGEDVSLTTEYAPHLPIIRADTGMLEQILLNLAVNSRDAMPGGGKLIIATSAETLGAEQSQQHPGAAPGLYVRLSMTDTGGGIPPEILPRIFEPFFTTKPVGKGTGLGLATVYGIVQQHRGWISLNSRLHEGTTFHIYLPAISGTVADHKDESAPVELAHGAETILLVEDEPSLSRSVGATLEYCGYTVLRAVSGTEALKVWREHAEQVRLVLTDVVMPDGLTGFDLARQLQAERPGLKIIYMSGYTGELAGAESPLVEGVNFLQKPFTARMVMELVRKRLDQE